MELVMAIGLFLQTAVQMGTHVLYATLGGILCEKTGNLNLGIEGMMLMGASVGFFAALSTGNPVLSVIAAGLAGASGALVYAFLTVSLRSNQVVTGLVLSIFGSGFSSMLGLKLSGNSLPGSITTAFAAKATPGLSDIPILGDMFFNQSVYVKMSIVAATVIYVYLNKTIFGLNTRMVGENPGAADASGINVTAYKYANILVGGFLCGVGGAYLSLVFVPRWQNNITAGAGWIAVAMVIFSTWSPLRAIGSAYFFGAIRGITFKMQNVRINVFGSSRAVSSRILEMLPYIATIAVLVLINLRKRKENQPPQALGNPYFREER